MKTTHTALLTTLLALGCSAAVAADEPPQAAIPFVNQKHSIRGWQADGREGLWIQDSRKQWYFAKLASPCIGLDFAVSLGFETRTTSTLDRFGQIVVPGYDRCVINSLVKSEAPPDTRKRRASTAPAPAKAN